MNADVSVRVSNTAFVDVEGCKECAYMNEVAVGSGGKGCCSGAVVACICVVGSTFVFFVGGFSSL